MVTAKLKYQSPRLTVLGNVSDVLLSDASPQVRQAVRMLAEQSREMGRKAQ
ncbi:MAG TPA: hypothetical protein VK913_04080 [Erythrobacter sp.]|nr:hypothetical protein [Erythrobacter sp.]